MVFPQHQFQRHYQTHHHQQQQEPQTKSFRNLQAMEAHMPPQVPFYNPTDLQDQSQHPPYIPPFHVVGFAPGPVPPADGSDGGVDLQWNYGLEPERKRLKEQDFLENNSQVSSVDFLQPLSVSTGLGLSLDNPRLVSTGDSALLSLIGDDIERELQQQELEVERFLKLQVQASQLQSVLVIEDRVLQKLREKEAEVESINRRNMELEDQMEQLTMEAGVWQQRAKHNESMIAALKFNLQQAYVQSRDSKEGCGDSEVDDTASCCNGRSIDFHLLSKENNGMREMMTCKACRVNEVNMLLLPCKHLCLCKDCEIELVHELLFAAVGSNSTKFSTLSKPTNRLFQTAYQQLQPPKSLH
ncbi:hypothetical protein Ahy_B06g086007 [Arachis hypogaea]|uniref:RING-type domain-containing protein n=1 Tax=Arachis hypogaea TaxID=3818 RepID=A0A444YWF5_ARAHY|nr:hypothetical protein Ahy_B06g086007 [Arachis hypogaea]